MMNDIHPAGANPDPTHRLVALGDSLTEGFQSFAIYNTDLSYPALIAKRLGIFGTFRYPEYKPVQNPNREGGWGPALNLEFLARQLPGIQDEGGILNRIRDAGELIEGAADALYHIDSVRNYWDNPARLTELGMPTPGGPMHNLAVSGYLVRDLFEQTAAIARGNLARVSELADLDPVPSIAKNAGPLMGLKVLSSAWTGTTQDPVYLSPIDAAKALGDDGGIETLILFIGANNALSTVITLKPVETKDDYQQHPGNYNLWRPQDFAKDMADLMAKVKGINAKHVLWGTVPHVTIAPIAHGVGDRLADDHRYFQYYTYPWFGAEFNPGRDPRLTGADAKHIDDYIDQYNVTIRNGVAAAKGEGHDWYIVETAALFDNFAYRRYYEGLNRDNKYPLPAPLAARRPLIDSRFFEADASGRTQGGLVALDGVHPTTVGYGLLAQEFMKVMKNQAGVAFPNPDQDLVDFNALLQEDTLVSNPPTGLTAELKILGKVQSRLDWVSSFSRLMGTSSA